MASSTSFENNVTGAYVVPGVRFGEHRYNFDAGVQVSYGSDGIRDFANAEFLVDMKMSFGGLIPRMPKIITDEESFKTLR